MTDYTVEQERNVLADSVLELVAHYCYSITTEDDGKTYVLHHGDYVAMRAFDVLVDCNLAEWVSDSAIRLFDCDE